jgi:sugar (pentulose or hexulose) kinase
MSMLQGPDPGAAVMHDLIAVLDVGKTHTRLSVVESGTGLVLTQVQRVNLPVLARGMAQLDIMGTQAWLFAALAALPHKPRVTALVPVGHGAACVLVDGDGEVLAAPDYEDSAFAATAAAYGRERSGFADTCSPRLPAGQNLGAQLHFLELTHADLWARARHVLLLPQFWSWRLCGVAASEVSSLGAHTDLWQPQRGTYSALAVRRGWCARLPPLRRASEVLGPLSAEVVSATGLPSTCGVLCGLHDSNASWLAQRQQAGDGTALTVVSSGTWTIVMSSGCGLHRLREERDMLANVDVFGAPVATARFMGGREYAAIAGTNPPVPALCELQSVVSARAMAMPSFVDAGGPFPGQAGKLLGAEELSPGQRAALATIYVALVTEVMLDLLGATDRLLVDGPFAANPLYPALLQTMRPANRVVVSTARSGTTAGALALVMGASAPPGEFGARTVEPLHIDGLADYRAAWRARCSLDERTT